MFLKITPFVAFVVIVFGITISARYWVHMIPRELLLLGSLIGYVCITWGITVLFAVLPLARMTAFRESGIFWIVFGGFHLVFAMLFEITMGSGLGFVAPGAMSLSSAMFLEIFKDRMP